MPCHRKLAFATGAAGGIGRATALAFARAGVHAPLNDEVRGRSVRIIRAQAAGLPEPTLVLKTLGQRVGELKADLSRRLNERRARFGRRADPEIVRVWGRIIDELAEIQLLLARAEKVQPGAVSALESLLATQPEAGRPWTLDFARTFDHSLRELVPLFADATYLRGAFGSKNIRKRFEQAFGEQRLADVDKCLREALCKPEHIETITAELRTVSLYRANDQRKDHARLAIRAATLRWMLMLLLLLVLGTGAVLAWAGDTTGSFVLVAASTGALGSVLSGFFRLRDDLHRLSDLRAFGAVLFVQPLVGAAAGLFAFLAVDAGVLDIPTSGSAPSYTPYGVYGFIAGFSEPFLLGVVKRLTPDERGAGQTASKK